MPDDELEREMLAAILAGRRRWGQRQLEDAFARFERGTPAERKRVAERQYASYLFLTKHTAVAGFYEYVESQCAKARMYDRLARMLTKAILSGLVHPEGADLRDYDGAAVADPAGRAAGPGQSGSIDYTRRHVQDIVRKVVPSAFVPTVGDDAPELSDSRRRPVRTVYSSGPLPKTVGSAKAEEAIVHEKSLADSSPQWNKMRELGFSLRWVSPTFIRSLRVFRELVRGLLSRMTVHSPEEGRRRAILLKMLCDGPASPCLLILHHDVWSHVGLSWWEKRSVGTQKALVARGFPFRVRADRVRQSASLLRGLGMTPAEIGAVMQVPAAVLGSIGERGDAVTIWRELAKIGDLPQGLGTVATANAAVELARQGKWKLAVPLFGQAIAGLDELGDRYEMAVALKNRGEARIRAGMRAGARDMEEADRLAESLEPAQRFAVHWNLAMAYLRLKDALQMRRYLKECLVDRDHVEPEWVLRVCDFLDATRRAA